MRNIHDFDSANNALMKYVPLAAHITGQNVTVERMLPLLKLVGNPHERLKVIHIAGTSGKTSTAYYTSALLKATGASVGLSVSPHIDNVAERVQVNGQSLSEASFCSYLSQFLELIGDAGPTYFELMIAFAFWVFDKLGVDYAVMETGLGGLHDSTNVASRRDKVCVITDIGYDHMNVLGNTLAEIAAQKAGIIKPANIGFMYEQSADVMNQINSEISAKSAKLELVGPNESKSNELPLFQQRNWWLARKVVEYLILRDGLTSLDPKALLLSQKIKIPGRMDMMRLTSGKTMVMDGAHNQQKMAAFVNSFMATYPKQKAAILLALKQDKDFEKVIDELLPITDKLILTSFSTSQDIPVKSINPEELAKYCRKKGIKNLQTIPEVETAYQELLKSKNEVLVITGSFYLISQIRSKHLTKQLPDQG